MPDLIAQGAAPEQRWRRPLPEGRACVLGRASGAWAAPWDGRISRRHAEICWRDGRLHVARLAESRNPVFYGGQQRDAFVVRPGEHFVIGDTTFTVADERARSARDAPRPVTEHAYSQQALERAPFRNADQRIAVLSRLPELISGAASDSEVYVRLVNLVLTGVPRAAAVALVRADAASGRADVLHWDRRFLSPDEFRPSERLIRRAVAQGESVVHTWGGGKEGAYTLGANVDWAFASPVRDEARDGWAIYVSGEGGGPTAATSAPSDPNDLRDDLKFTELVAATFAGLRDRQRLERRQASLSQFLSPVVLDALAGHDPDVVLAPREADVAVMFCDLRGFSRQSEMQSHNLLDLLHRVSESLGVMTRHILDQSGVVGDFHGDAAMGFWGWPLSQPDFIDRACQAALAIRAHFAAAALDAARPLSQFRVGIGIAAGRAMAGKIGTVDQVKVTVFGPVVNLASRLEGMTKFVRAPILLDEAAAQAVRENLPRSAARVRRVARVRPYGLATAIEVSELLPPESAFPQLAERHIAAYEAALDALQSSDWEEAFLLLHQVPPEDRVKDFLTAFIVRHGRTAPDTWDGVIPLTEK